MIKIKSMKMMSKNNNGTELVPLFLFKLFDF